MPFYWYLPTKAVPIILNKDMKTAFPLATSFSIKQARNHGV
jgi:hypothetical protein